MIYLIGNKEIFKNSIYDVCDVDYVIDYFKNHSEIEVDTETTGFDPHTCKLLTIQLGDCDNQFILDCSIYNPTVFKELLESDKLFLLQNAKFDLRFFLHHDINIKRIYDTFLAECILTTGLKDRELGLDALALKYCGITLDKSIRGNIHKEGLTTRVIQYCADDVKYLNLIRNKQLKQIERLKLEPVLDLECRVVRVFARIEYDGVTLDTLKWTDVYKSTEELTEESVKKLDALVMADSKLKTFVPKGIQTNLFGLEERRLNINWSSPKQKLKIIRTLGFKTDTVGDRFLQNNKKKSDLIKLLIDYNKYDKLASSFGKSFLKFVNKKTKRVHFDIWPILKTGRISISNPNVNQIPSKGELGKKIRSCFKPREGYKMVGGDFNAMELRLIAEFSQDPLWLDAFRNKIDLHSLLCSKTFDIPIEDVEKPFPKKPDLTYRYLQKTLNFGLCYGMSKFKFAEMAQITVEESDEIIKKFFAVVPRVEYFLNNLASLGVKRGYIRTAQPFGRIRWFDFDPEDFKSVGSVQRASKNTVPQGSNGDIIKLALINVLDCIEKENLPVNILLAVYDEIQTECREDYCEEWKSKLQEIMIDAAKVVIKTIPVKVDCKITDCWEK